MERDGSVNAAEWRSLIHRFSQLKTLVVGDLMLDHFVWGAVSRISPEAPVPVVEVLRETEMPGGAGNVAINMAVLGAQVQTIGVIGQDAAGERLNDRLKNFGVHSEFAIRTQERPTILKTRIIAHHQQVVRVDREVRGDLSVDLKHRVLEQVKALLPQVHAVVLSDYGKGVVDHPLINALIPLCRARRIPITVDPKTENFRYYRHVTCLTPNLKEAMEGAGVFRIACEGDVEALGHRILKLLASDSVLITRGEQGMSLFEHGKQPRHIPTRAREVFDVTGAGDTVISVLTMALAAGASVRDAAELANFAAGVVVGKIGTANVTPKELLTAIKDHV